MSIWPSHARRQARARSADAPFPRRRRRSTVGAQITAFESETHAVFESTTPVSEHVILYVLVGMVAIALGLMSIAKLDRVVTSIGRIVPVGGTLYVQPFQESIVRQILVKVGDVVKKGQVLATLDPTFAAADLKQLQLQVLSDSAAMERDTAEQRDQPYAPVGRNPYQLQQLIIWQRRQAEYHANIANYNAQIASAKAAISQYTMDIAEYGKRLNVASRVEFMHTTLEKDGFGSKLQALVTTDSRIEIGRLLSDSRNQLAASQGTLQSVDEQRAAYIEKWHSDVGNDIVTNQKDLDQAQQALKKAQKISQLVELTAPSDAIVLKIGKFSRGTVASPPADLLSEPLFTLTPLNAPLEASVDIDADDIGFVRVGDPVEIKLDAYRYMAHGMAKGVVKTISEGSFTTNEDSSIPHQTPSEGTTLSTVSPFFKARVELTDVHLRNVPANFRLIPGDTLTADIVVGHRTILSYLVEGALRIGSEAMREP
jgi:hemolysin D